VVGQDETVAGRNIEDSLVDRAFHLLAGAVEVDFRAGIEAGQVIKL